MKQKKHDLIPFSFYDLTGIARHLEKQAARGWMIEKSPISAGATGPSRPKSSALLPPTIPRPRILSRSPATES